MTALELEEFKEDVCDNYCKYPSRYRMEYIDPDEAYANMLWEKCSACPVNIMATEDK